MLLLASGNQGLNRSNAAQSTSNQITQQWLDQMLPQWKPAQNTSVGFQVLFPRASYGNLETSYNSMDVQTADLNMLVSTGAGCVRIDLGYAPWLTNNQTAINEATTLVQDVRAAGKCLVLADAASETYRNGGALPWTQFKQAWIQRVSTLAALFHPDYYVVIKEPGWYIPFVSDALTNPDFQNASDWANLTQSLASAVTSASPSTKVGVSVAADDLSSNPTFYDAFLNSDAKLSDISFLGFDIYDPVGFSATTGYLTTYGNGGKSVWIAEAWSGGAAVAFDPSRASLDKLWLEVLYYYAQNINASQVMLFYTDCLASYSLTSTSPATPSEIVSLYSQREPVYSELQAVETSGSNSTSTETQTTTSSTTSAASSSSLSSQTTSASSASSSLPSSSPAGEAKSVSSSVSTSTRSTVRTTTSFSSSGGGGGLFSPALVAGEAIILLVLVAAVFYFRRPDSRKRRVSRE
jgi:hypothetical protein